MDEKIGKRCTSKQGTGGLSMWQRMNSDQIARHLKPRLLHKVVAYAHSVPALAICAANGEMYTTV